MIVCFIFEAYSTKVTTTAPVNPVSKSELLSIHCHVRDLNPNHEVSIHRKLTNGKTERLSVDEDVPSSVDDRVFLAVRQLDNGAVVYFLTIIDVTRADEGLYSCKVVNTEKTLKVAESKLNITVHYFPSDPICSQIKQLEVLEGTTISMNCTSEIGNPSVSIKWKRGTSGSAAPEAKQISRGDITFSELKVQLTVTDTNSFFLCEITSKPFGSKTSSCHFGPFTVRPNPGFVKDDLETPDGTLSSVMNTGGSDKGKITTQPVSKEKCLEQCSPYSTSVLFWVIATVSSAIIALLFLIMGLTLIVKYMKIRKSRERTFIAHRAGEDIYAEVENKGDSRLYMSLQRPENTTFRIVSAKQEYNKDYHEAPSVAKL